MAKSLYTQTTATLDLLICFNVHAGDKQAKSVSNDYTRANFYEYTCNIYLIMS